MTWHKDRLAAQRNAGAVAPKPKAKKKAAPKKKAAAKKETTKKEDS